MPEVTTQLRRTSVSWYAAYPEAFANRNTPTVAEMNGALVKDITCAVAEDGTAFSLSDSDTDDTYSYCDESGVSRPTFYNPAATLAILRDNDRAATGDFAQALGLLMFPDAPLYIIKRVGDQDNTPGVNVATGDRLKMQYIKTDYPQDTLSSGDPVYLTSEGMQQGWVNWNYEVAS